jgi:hypothetical protein
MRFDIAHKRWALALALTGLAACGGGGSVGPSAPPAAPPPGKVFFADAANRAIGSLIDPNPPPGSIAVDRIVSGPDTGLGTAGGTPSESAIPSVALDAAAERLFVATQSNALVFDQIGTASGDVPPSRTITAAGVNFLHLSLDTRDDVLYTVDPAGVVHVFDGASTRNGPTTPDRTITPDLGGSAVATTFGLAIDNGRDLLYVGVATSPPGIVVFNNASTTNTTSTPIAPNRTLSFATPVGSFCLDQERDILYVAQSDGRIVVFDNASTLATGTPTAKRTMTLPVPASTASSRQPFISVDTTNNRLYAVNGTTAFVVSGASVADDAMLGATQITVSSGAGPSLFSAVAVGP